MGRGRGPTDHRGGSAVAPSPPADPVAASVEALGRKWTLLLLRDLAFKRTTRFSEFLRDNPGLTPRVLSRRLREMQTEGLTSRSGRGRTVTYVLTPRGQDAVFILLALLRYGLKWYAGPAPLVAEVPRHRLGPTDHEGPSSPHDAQTRSPSERRRAGPRAVRRVGSRVSRGSMEVPAPAKGPGN